MLVNIADFLFLRYCKTPKRLLVTVFRRQDDKGPVVVLEGGVFCRVQMAQSITSVYVVCI